MIASGVFRLKPKLPAGPDLQLTKGSVNLSRMFPPHLRRAFTRTELLATCAALFLIATIVLPALAVTKSDSGRMVCFNNLRLMGRGVITWAADHNQQFSWRSWPLSEGGSQQPRPGIAWLEYSVLSNELVTPTILACPSDTGVRRARIFDTDPNGGFSTPTYRNNAVSYPLHLDGSMDAPHSWLSGDRNLQADGVSGGCSAGVTSAHLIWASIAPDYSSLRWTNAVHGTDLGHVLTTDGAVEFTSSARMREIILRQEIADNGASHFLRAR